MSGVRLHVLFVSPTAQLDPKLGGPQTVLELAKALRRRGCEVRYFSAGDVPPGASFADALFRRLRTHPEIRVVDVMEAVELQAIPEDLRDRLWVARVTLLEFHFPHIRFPQRRPGLLGRLLDVTVGRGLRWRAEKREVERRMRLRRFYEIADLIAVANRRDARRLVDYGVEERKVVVQRYGLAEDRGALLEARRAVFVDPPRLVFLGTFDYRKGCWDLVRLFGALHAADPRLRLVLLGTRGLCPDERAVRRFFPAHLQGAISVTSSFAPEDLPRLLEGARLGVFPSYVESFGLAVIEMLAAGLPVLAYDAPGPDEILPSEWLCPTGDVAMLTRMARKWLNLEKAEWEATSARARNVAARFSWQEPAAVMEEAYRRGWGRVSPDASGGRIDGDSM